MIAEKMAELAELEDLIRCEQKLAAMRHHGEAWAGSVYDGIDHDILADTALDTAFQEIVRVEGEAGALDRLARLKDRVLAGEFDMDLVRH